MSQPHPHARGPLAFSKEALDRLWAGVPRRIARTRRRRQLGALAVVGAGALLFFALPRQERELMTTDSPQLHTLRDGTRLTLTPATHVRVLANKRSDVRLSVARGAVDLDVPARPDRRLAVEAGAYDVVVRGTRLRVAVSDAFEPEVEVTVASGRVEVRERRGQKLVRSLGVGQRWSASAIQEDRRPPRFVDPGAERTEPVEPRPQPQALRTAVLPSEAFLTRRGRTLLWGDQPYRYIGFNAFTLTGCGFAHNVPTPAELRAFFGSLRPNSLIRTMAFPAQGLVAIEAVVEAALAHGHKVILVLSNHDGNCGDVRKNAAWYAGGYRTTFLPWVRTLATRLADSPGVGMWELAQEPRDVEAAVLRGFYDEVGGELHRLAPRHLVVSGSHGTFAYGEAGYRLMHESPGIDVASFQDFGMTWGAPSSLGQALRALEGLDKPLVMGSVAFAGSPGGDPNVKVIGKTCLPWTTRVDAFRAKLTASFAAGLAGACIWNWMPHGSGTCRLETYPDDPLMAAIRELVY